MKKALTSSFLKFLALILIVPSTAMASPPLLLHYQGRLDSGGAPVNGTVRVELRLYEQASGGTPLYVDDANVAVENGLLNTYLGDNTTSGDLVDALSRSEVWLEPVINGNALLPRQRLASSPYALLAGHATTATNASQLGGFPASRYLRDNVAGEITLNDNSNAALSITQSGTQNGIFATSQATAAGRGAVIGLVGAAGPTINSAAGVVGTSQNARGVIGSSGSSDGVFGFSSSGNGVHGQSDSGTGVRAFSSTGTALYTQGRAEINGNLSVTGRIDNNMAPIALGYVNSDSTIVTSSGNFSCVWHNVNDWYVITITGYDYFFSSYVTHVQTSVANTTARVASVSGKLVVQIRDSSGTLVQSPFQFVTYKP